ncbi:MAG TPA: PIG-L family deacetylase [Actinomycetota bacterium]|nr:PIG-L family deacetylase [Actinomycetota bacterium]
MATLVFFHAHPDDESIGTGGTIAKSVAAGHRVVLVTATGGEQGEYPDGFLGEGQELGEARADELAAAAGILGVARVEPLGYRDSGMVGTPENDVPECFWQADVEEAAVKLAAILREESAEVLVVYDENGVYGHPDHVQVHRVGVRAAEIAAVSRVFETTVNRTAWRRRMTELAVAEGAEAQATPTIDFPIGVEEDELSHAIDVSEFIDVKRKAMRAHASQITDESWFMKMSDEDFAAGFGTEWFRLRGAPGGTRKADLLADA